MQLQFFVRLFFKKYSIPSTNSPSIGHIRKWLTTDQSGLGHLDKLQLSKHNKLTTEILGKSIRSRSYQHKIHNHSEIRFTIQTQIQYIKVRP